MQTRTVLLPLLAGTLLGVRASAQRFVSLDGLGPPSLTAVPAPPAATPPPCAPLPPPCLLPFLPPFPPGVVPPSFGGEAIDEATGIAYVTDGAGIFTSVAYPGCVPGPVFPLPAWPAGPCGPVGGPPIVAMCDSAVPGAIWVVNALGVLSLIPVAPGPPLAQTIVPPAIPPGTVTGITFDPATGTLWLTGAFTPFAVGLPPIPVGMFPCGMLPFGPLIPIPACLPPPFIGITVNSAVAPGPIPALTVSNGLMTANLATGACTCPVSPPAPLPTTDIDFADVPFSYGAGCGCGPPTIGSAGGYPVLGNGAFTITGIGFGPGPGVAALALSIAPGPFPLACGCVVNLFPGFLIFLPAVAVGPGGPPPCPGTAAVPVGVPAGPPALVGIPLYFEWVRIPGATPCGFELSDGLEVVVGFP